MIYQNELDPKHKKTIVDGLNHHAHMQKDLGQNNGSFSFVIENANKELEAGISGFYYDGCFHIDMLFVAESCRSKGYGSDLVQKAEELAHKKGCLFMSVNTMDYQARPFYEKHGFKVEFTREGFEKDSKMYCMRKEL